jgi:F0F1-type ATP synthase assembly protein I
MEEVVVALAVTVPIIGLFVMLVYLRRIENSERLAMIEKGVDPTLFAKKQRNTSFPLRVSLLCIGVGMGFLLGYFLDRQFYMDEVGYFSMLFIFGGLGLGGAYLVEEKKNRQSGN